MLRGVPSLDTLVMHAGLCANRNKDSVPVMRLKCNKIYCTMQGIQNVIVWLLLEAGRWHFYSAGSWSWRAVASAVRCVFTIAPKANRPTLRCSLTAWLMTNGTRSLWPSVPLMSYYTLTATGKMPGMYILDVAVKYGPVLTNFN